MSLRFAYLAVLRMFGWLALLARSGAPELLARYRNAPPAAAALIDAAMDARRLGMGASLPQAFLEAAAPGYLTDDQWDALGEDWPEQALAYTAVPAKGARGPLTRIRPMVQVVREPVLRPRRGSRAAGLTAAVAGGVLSVAVTPDGTRAVSGGDWWVRVWDLAAGLDR